MMKARKGNAGFTLAEVLSAVIVMLMTTGLVVSVTGQMLDFSREERMQNEIEREVTFFLDYLERDIKTASEVQTDYPAASPAAQSLTLKVPQFTELGLPMNPQIYNYVVYEYFYETGLTRRSVYADAEGTQLLASQDIDNGPCYFVALVDWAPVDSGITPTEDADEIQIALLRYNLEPGTPFYWRSFIMDSVMRNKI
jgi:hypothetical protein